MTTQFKSGHVNTCNSRVKSWQYFCTHNISLESVVHWLSEDTVKFEVGVEEKCKKGSFTPDAVLYNTVWYHMALYGTTMHHTASGVNRP